MNDQDGFTLYYLIWLVPVGISLALHIRRTGALAALKSAAIWAALLVVIAAVALNRDKFGTLGGQLRGELDPAGGRVSGQTMMFTARRDGHFWVRAKANGQPLLFVVDTGASTVTLTQRDAARIGIDLAALRFNAPMSTANGVSFGAPVRLLELSAGPVHMRDVAAIVGPPALDVNLLGQNFLRGLASYQVSGDRLTMTAR